MKKQLTIIAALLVAACASTPDIDLATYAPVIDIHRVDQKKYTIDLQQCRGLGITAYRQYKIQREKEEAAQRQSAIVGAVVGAAIGSALGEGSTRQGRRSATTFGALQGAAVGAGSTGVDYFRAIAKFGPTIIVDRCMTDRGYRLLSQTGYGGG